MSVAVPTQNPRLDPLRAAQLVTRHGRLTKVMPTYLEAVGPDVSIGTVCEVPEVGGSLLAAEVVGLDQNVVKLMPYGATSGLRVGARIVARRTAPSVGVGNAFLGRVIDGLGNAIDGAGAIAHAARRQLNTPGIRLGQREATAKILETGIKVIDTVLTLGVGQRIGVFAGSGAGKTTLLAGITRSADADCKIVCLVGERGREAFEFWRALDESERSHTVQVVSTSDEPAIMRVRAVAYAVALAEHFRDEGGHVLFVLDSVTRYATALREIGLAAGEPPTIRAYTPSVFSALPRLFERCGTVKGGGAITAVASVLTEDASTEDPLAEALKSLLDGHIVLSRELAEQGHFPAVDVPRSISRLAGRLVSTEELSLAQEATGRLSALESARVLLDSGLYKAGGDPLLDRAVAGREALRSFLQQAPGEVVKRADALRQLRHCLNRVENKDG